MGIRLQRETYASNNPNKPDLYLSVYFDLVYKGETIVRWKSFDKNGEPVYDIDIHRKNPVSKFVLDYNEDLYKSFNREGYLDRLLFIK